ncbi:MAG TPA: hypothetical protein VHT91_00825 [Kofleriaceae bacterium]|jgi:hypothetical protein|nr:hypothetical protein [Kofleriaceae bacterium]
MRFEDRVPEVEEVQLAPAAPAISVIDLEPSALDIAAAVETAGQEKTDAALAQVQSGVASPEALLVWIDDLRDPERQASDVDPADQQEGVIPDFIKDTQLASGAADAPPSAGNAGIETPPLADEDYFFSAIRRRRVDDDRHASPLDPDTIVPADKEKTTSGT